jgi:hypothetical protein
MASDNQLNIAVVVDASQLQSALPAATAVVNDAFTSLAAAQIRVSTASKELNSTLNTLAKSGLAPTAEQTEEVAAAMFEAESAAAAFSAASQQAYGSTEKLATGANNARIAFGGLVQDLGIKGSRALGSFIAQSETLAPLMSAAFSGIAAIAFVEIISRIPDAIKKASESLMGWNQQAKQAYEFQVKLNETIDSHRKELALDAIANAEAGLKGTARTAQEIADINKKIALLKQYQAEQGNVAAQAERELAAVTVIPAHIAGRVLVERQEIAVIEKGSDAWNERNKRIEDATAKVAEYGNEIKKLEQVETPRAKATLGTEQQADAEKALKERIAAANAEIDLAERQQKSINQLIATRDKEAAELAQLAAAETEFFAKENEKQTTEDVKGLAERSAAEQKFAADRLRDAQDEAVAEIAIAEKKVQEELRLGQITNQQALTQLDQLAAQKLAIEMKYFNDRAAEIQSRLVTDDAAAYAKDLAEWSKLLSDKQKAEDQFNAAMVANTDKTLTNSQKQWQSFGKSIGQSIDSAFKSMITSSQSFEQVMLKLGGSLLDDLANVFLKIAEKWALSELKQLATHSSFLTNLLGLDAANNAAKTATNAAAAVLQVQQQAGIAGAAGFASVMADVPFPLNVSMAPEVAAASIAAVESFGSIASAAGGMVVPRDGTLAKLHENEMVLPADLSGGIRKMVGGGGGAGFGGGGDIHVHMGDVSALDAKGVDAILRERTDTIISVIKRAQREFRI